MVSAGWPCDRVSSSTGAGRLGAGRLSAGRPWAGSSLGEAGGPISRCRLRVGWDGGECWTVDLDRVVAEALGSDVVGCDERMPERAMVM